MHLVLYLHSEQNNDYRAAKQIRQIEQVLVEIFLFVFGQVISSIRTTNWKFD